MAAKRCFVVMGFGTKTDYVNGRKLNLDKSYRVLIKPVVESRGIECVRADEIIHSGSIDVKMYQELLQADLVIADLSTANPNALYELGVRHALRPFTTIVISEDKLVYPFDLNHILISSYKHLGDAIGYEEVGRFREALGKQIDEVLQKQESDSPVYTYLNSLIPPKLADNITQQSSESGSEPSDDDPAMGQALSFMIETGEEAIHKHEFSKARDLFKSALTLSEKDKKQKDIYLVHRLAFCTYKAAEPTLKDSLYTALGLLDEINLAHSNDTETVAMAGTIKKKLHETGEGSNHLEDAILFFQRSYYLLNNRYHGINLAICCVYRATSELCKTKEQQIADLVTAQRTWERVLFLCDRDEKAIHEKLSQNNSWDTESIEGQDLKEYYLKQKFWIAVNRAEANFGLGNFEAYEEAINLAKNISHPKWMWDSFKTQLKRLTVKLKESGQLMNPAWALPNGN